MAFKKYFMPLAFHPDGAISPWQLSTPATENMPMALFFSIIVAPLQGYIGVLNSFYNSYTPLGLASRAAVTTLDKKIV
jgi:hypothetical protein